MWFQRLFCRRKPEGISNSMTALIIINYLKSMEKRIMSSINDVNAALDGLGASLVDQLDAIQIEIQQLATVQNSDALNTIASRIADFKNKIDASITALKGDDPVAPPPPEPAKPTIESITPMSGAVGDAVVINGSGFSSETVTVTFNGAQAEVVTQTDTSITTSVPDGASTGPVTVETVGAQLVTFGTDFTVNA